MSDTPTYMAEGIYKTDAPKQSKWKCIMFGGNPALTFHPEEGMEPNWFHRKMQGLILGHKWVNTEQGE